MSSAESRHAAQLYLDAVAADLPTLFKSGKCGDLHQSFRNFQVSLLQNKLVVKNADKDATQKWVINEEAFDTLDAKADANLLTLYQNTVAAHEFSAKELREAGKETYLSSFRDYHSGMIEELSPEVISVPRDEGLQKVASQSLYLLQAVDDDPANAAFVKGLDGASLNQLRGVLETSGYLMPGENTDRSADIGEQNLRGTTEEKSALFDAAAIIAVNLDVADGFKQGDKCTAAAFSLKQAVAATEFDEIETTSRSKSAMNEFADSSLAVESASALYSVLQTAEDMLATADMDPENPMQCITVDSDKHAAVVSAIAVYEDYGIEHALTHKDAYVPGIDKKDLKQMAIDIDHLRTAVVTDARTLDDSGNEGELALESSAATSAAAAASIEGAFDAVEEDEETGTTSNNKVKVYQMAEMGVSEYGASESKIRVIEGLVDPVDRSLHAWTQDGTINQIARHAGRTHEAPIDRGAAEHGNVDQFLGTGIVTSKEVAFASTEMSNERYMGLPKDRRDKMRPTQIKPGHGVFKDYRPGNSKDAPKNLQRYIRDNMLDKNGKPNLALRSTMQEGNQNVIVATYASEAQAARSIFADFAEHANVEYQERIKASREKQGITNVDIKASDAMRFVKVARAANPDMADDQIMARFALSPDGSVTMSRNDSPKIHAKMNTVPKEIEGGEKSKRTFGGNLSINNLEAAIHGGREQITVRFAGEVPFAAIAKVDEEKVRTKKQSRFQDVQLS